MTARLPALLLAAAFAAALGCGSKKKPFDDDGPPEPDDPTEYTITLKEPGAGTSLRGSFKIDMRLSIAGTDKSGNPLAQKPVEVKEHITFKETILEKPAGAKRPTKASITFETWEKGGGPQVKALSREGIRERLVGREVLFEKRDGVYEFRGQDGGPVDPDVRIYLEKRYNELVEGFNAADFLPGKPVRKNVSWDVPVKRLAKALGQAAALPFDESRSWATGKLRGVYEKDGHKYGRIDLTANLVPAFGKGDREVKVTDGARIEIRMTVLACIDGSVVDVSVDGKAEAGFEVKHEAEGSVKVEMKGTIAVEEAEVKK